MSKIYITTEDSEKIKRLLNELKCEYKIESVPKTGKTRFFIVDYKIKIGNKSEKSERTEPEEYEHARVEVVGKGKKGTLEKIRDVIKYIVTSKIDKDKFPMDRYFLFAIKNVDPTLYSMVQKGDKKAKREYDMLNKLLNAYLKRKENVEEVVRELVNENINVINKIDEISYNFLNLLESLGIKYGNWPKTCDHILYCAEKVLREFNLTSD